MPVESTGWPLRILVAEDEPLAAMVIEEALTDSGCQVFLAKDGLAALEFAESGSSFDVLLTDLSMPRMPGWELIPALRARRPDLPVVVMTGFLPPELAPGLRAGPRDPIELLLKPFELGALVGALQRVFCMARAA